MYEFTRYERDQIRKFVVSRTTRGVRKDDILLKICEEFGLSWQEAEALVDELLAESSKEVALRHNLIYGVIALATFLAGLLIGIDRGYRFISRLSLYSNDASGIDWGLLVKQIFENYSTVASLLLSIVLLVVGLWGLWRSVGDFFLSLFKSDTGS